MRNSIWCMLCTICVFSSCITLRPLEFTGVDNINFNSEKPALTFDVKLHNPNRLAVTLRKVDIDLYSGDSLVNGIVSKPDQRIPANADFVIPVSVNASVGDLIDLGLQVFNSRKSPYSIRGRIVVSKFIFRRSFRIDERF